MLFKESIWIKSELAELLKLLPAREITLLNLGSSSEEFSSESQPYIWENVFRPLKDQVRVVNVDIRHEPGVDLVLDFLDPGDRKELIEIKPDIILVSNLLEHLDSAVEGIKSLSMLGTPGTYIVLTGPRLFPFHPDPIDKGFRPSKRKLRALLEKRFKILKLEIINGGSVLTCTSADKSVAYTWYRSLFKQGFKLQEVKSIALSTKNLCSPAFAFVCVLQILPTD